MRDLLVEMALVVLLSAVVLEIRCGSEEWIVIFTAIAAALCFAVEVSIFFSKNDLDD